jgi:hypothetical protein
VIETRRVLVSLCRQAGLAGLSRWRLLEAFFGASAPTDGSGCHPDDKRQRLSTVCGLRSTVWSPVLWVTVAGSFFPLGASPCSGGATLPLWSAALCCRLSAAAPQGPPATGKGRIKTQRYSRV